MKKLTFLAILLAVSVIMVLPVKAQNQSALDILKKVDDNEVYDTIRYEGEMIIDYQNRRYVKTMTASAKGNSDSFVEFTNPEDRGTKYLKKGSRLYVYSPDNEEVMLISGHMLKESMMGSDLSYEDTIDNEKLSVRYDPVIAGSETYGGREAWILDLTAKKRTESYPKQRLWVDKENYDLLHYELFALSGAKLKEYTLIRAETFGTRRFPVESEMRDLLRKGSKTTFVLHTIVLDEPISDSVFSMRNLER
ncbi:outer membrane lipoprotein-sorting protein [Breznakiella homolactica]|uniref:Outer membrane lipoprotein-sorting protein n=1 Tax=Breznakiella homolactica TaxID=2798577 RepID=A0A7T7XJD3_9SPIR|nr:outer membrane lipoprotein-sorting protein [Breznakiella homolactica]QQO07451.1 outer membrane lipoprotein-sorting protein [Breznakiella homolactica]